MRNSNTHSLTMKKKLKKSKTTFNAYNELQYRYGIKLDESPDIVELCFWTIGNEAEITAVAEILNTLKKK